MKQIGIKLDDKLAEELKLQAKQNGITLSELCRRKLTQENQPVQVEQVGQMAQPVNIEKLEKQNAEIQNVLMAMYQILNRQASSDTINERLQNIENTIADIQYDNYKLLANNMYLLLNLAIPNDETYKKNMLELNNSEKFINLIDNIISGKVLMLHDKKGVLLNNNMAYKE